MKWYSYIVPLDHFFSSFEVDINRRQIFVVNSVRQINSDQRAYLKRSLSELKERLHPDSIVFVFDASMNCVNAKSAEEMEKLGWVRKEEKK